MKKVMLMLIEIGIVIGLLVGLLVSPPSIPWLTRLIICVAVFGIANAFLIVKRRQSQTHIGSVAAHPKPRLYLVFILLGLYWLACLLLRVVRT
jgi:uncharacterized membrane protein SirB2